MKYGKRAGLRTSSPTAPQGSKNQERLQPLYGTLSQSSLCTVPSHAMSNSLQNSPSSFSCGSSPIEQDTSHDHDVDLQNTSLNLTSPKMDSPVEQAPADEEASKLTSSISIDAEAPDVSQLTDEGCHETSAEEEQPTKPASTMQDLLQADDEEKMQQQQQQQQQKPKRRCMQDLLQAIQQTRQQRKQEQGSAKSSAKTAALGDEEGLQTYNIRTPSPTIFNPDSTPQDGDYTSSFDSAARSSSPDYNGFEEEEEYFGGEPVSVPTKYAWLERATANDEAVNESTESSFSDVQSKCLQGQLQHAYSRQPFTDGKRFHSGKTIFAIQARVSQTLLDMDKQGIDACLIFAQTKSMGPFELYSRRLDGGSRVVDILRDQGYESALVAASDKAFTGVSDTKVMIPGGCKEESSCKKDFSPLTLIQDDNGVRLAPGMYCVPDSVYNVLKSMFPDLILIPFREAGEDGDITECQDLGILLRVRVCDDNGDATMEKVAGAVSRCRDFPFDLTRLPKQYRAEYSQLGPEGRRDFLIELSKKGHMFIIQCHRQGDYSSTHYVGLVNGVVYDNDAKTGGKIDAYKYAEDYLAGVKKAKMIVPRPVSKKKRKRGDS